MVKYAKRGRRRFRRRRGGVKRRRYRRMRKRQYIKNFVRSMHAGTIQASGGGSIVFKLSLLPNVAEYTALFDQYRIRGVRLLFMPSLTQTQVVQNAPGVHGGIDATAMVWDSPILSEVVDHTDSSAPTSEAELMQYDSVRQHRVYQPFKRYIVPRAANDIFRGVTPAYGVAGKRQWLQTAYADAEYYGWKHWTEGSWPDGLTIRVYAKYYIQFRAQK